MRLINEWLGEVRILLALGFVLGWIGPFGTYPAPPALRFGYWMLALPLVGIPVSVCLRLVRRRASRWSPLQQALLGSVVAGLPASLIIIVLDRLFWAATEFGGGPDSVAEAAYLYCSITLLIACIAVPFQWLRALRSKPRSRTEPGKSAVTAHATALLRRLPAELGQDLLYIEAEDHYVRVHTAAGNALLLLRFSDALDEVDPDLGLRVHRSYWVARSAIRRAKRANERTWLELTNGADVPVSRSYLPRLREAGWLFSAFPI